NINLITYGIRSKFGNNIFDENRFSSIPRSKDIIPNVQGSQMDGHTNDVPSEIPKPRKEEDPKTYNEAMQSRDAALWKEIVISFGCYSQSGDPSNEWETAFLNGDLDEEVYMKQLEGFVMPGNKHKFDSSGKGVIICLYVDDMLIFGTDRNQVDETKKFLSSRFSMKDMGEADVILGTKDYGLSYVGYPSVLEGYLDASRINHVEDSSSTSGWVFLLGGCNDSSFRSTYILSLR
ncbi:zinc finger, CCHC-type containing protein, partial [Tanacetum coccineum]